MKKSIFHIILVGCLILMAKIGAAQFYTGSQNTFGQNRVQYNPAFWQSYNFERFEVYFTASGKQHAEYTAKSAHRYLKEVEEFLDYDLEDKLQFLVFNTQSAYRQSNIGLRNEEETNIGGVTRVDGDKVFVFYEGDHEKLDRQIRSGIANIILYKMMYGDNWKQAIKSSALSTFPDWFIQGFVEYMAGDWNTDLDNKVKNKILSGRFDKFNHLRGEEAKLAGLAIWNYVAEVYGEKMIPNILYMTRVSRNVENGFLYVLGANLRSLSRDFVAYYKERYTKDNLYRIDPKEEVIPIKTKKNRVYQQFALSPDGKYAAFTTNELGQYKVWLYDIQEEKLKKIAKGQHKLDRLPDYSHPVVAWHPTSAVLAFVEEKKGELKLNLYDIEDGKKHTKILMKMEKVLSMSYSDNGKKIVLSAVAKGQTDLFVYNVIGNNQKQITNDIYDDLMPSFIDKSSRVIFVSNRHEDTIRKKVEIKQYSGTKDIFIVDLKQLKMPLTRITNTPLVDESYPNQYDDKHYSYLSNANGINNRYIAYYDSAISYIDTAVHYEYFTVAGLMSNFSRNVLEYRTNPKEGTYSMLMLNDGKYQFYRGKQADGRLIEDEIQSTVFMNYKIKAANKGIPSVPTKVDDVKIDSNKVDIDNYIFEDEKQPEIIVEKVEEIDSLIPIKKEDSVTFELPRTEIYNVNFSTDYVVSQIDNSFLNQSYQRYTGGSYQNPGINALMKIGLIDLFEDYRLVGGYRFPINFNNSEYLLSLENVKSRLDKKYLISRQAFNRPAVNGDMQKLQTYDAKYNVKYPFSEVASLRLTTNLRYDRLVTLSTEQSTLEEPDENHYLLGTKLEYVYDNTRNIGLNIKYGTRFKLWGEFYRELDQVQTDFFVLGVDFRHYQKIHREIVLASRFAASTSMGHQRLLYYLGGVDNWLTPRFNSSFLPDPEQNYQFQTIATPLRGFEQNIRNGNTFALINTELRVPVVKYFSKNPVKSSFWENFMIIGLADIGASWTGVNPYTSDNAFNTKLIIGHNYQIILKDQREPIVYGYGFGLRSKLFGYYIRFDWAWGVDDGEVLSGVRYLSLSLDF